jgi:Protein of unknown function (DUF2934)
MPKTTTTKPKTSRATKYPMQEEIALRAYHIYLERKGAPGNPFEDWTRAERELLQQRPKKPAARRKSKVTCIAA